MTSSPTTVYLFAGDGLTEGVYGESYVERVAKLLHEGRAGLEGEVVNTGRRNDTVQSLLDRIDEPLRRYQPRWMVLAVGTNDVWLPWLSSHSFGWWLWFAYRRIVLGQTPATDLDQFAAAYRGLIDKAQALARARVLACTVSPVGEQLASPVNQQLARLNGVIKHVAADRKVPVADVWQAFIEQLSALPRPSSYVPGEWLFAWLDRRRLRSTSPDKISRRRRLLLTFDGIHPNSRGADLWAATVVTALAMAQGKGVAAPPSLAQQPDLSCFMLGPLQVFYSLGWEGRARELGRLLTDAYRRLASLVGVRPHVYLAVLNHLHWNQAAAPRSYPMPSAREEDGSGTVFVPEAYTDKFLRDVHLPETMAARISWPPELAEVGEPARATALADLLAVEELARLFLRELHIAPVDPALDHLLVAYLTHVVLRSRGGEGAAELVAVWDAWGGVLARHGVAEGLIRLQAKELYLKHGDGLASTLASRASVIREQAEASPLPIAAESS